MIPPAPSPGPAGSPPPKPSLAPEKAQQLDAQFADALKVRRVQPSGLLFLSLTEAVRVALYQNSELRMAGEDVQSARGALKQAIGEFDSKLTTGGQYALSYTPAPNGNLTQRQFSQVFQNTLVDVLTGLKANPALAGDIQGLVNSSYLKSSGQLSATETQVVGGDASISKKFRNGVSVDLGYQPALLDAEGRPTWPPSEHSLTLFVQMNLSKMGNAYNGAGQRSATQDYQASLLQLSHAATKTTSNVVNAYWKAAAALEKLYLADQAYRISDTLLGLTEELARADVVPMTEAALASAKTAEALGNRSAALIQVYTTSKDLAATLGLKESQLRHLPLASEPFPALTGAQITRLNLDRLVDFALVNRFDRQAALKTIESKRIQAEKARVDLRPDITFGIGGGPALINNAKIGNGQGYSLRGTVTSLVGLSLPFANNQKEGALLDAQANLNKSLISLEDVSRSIFLNLRDNLDTLQGTQQQITDSANAVKYYTVSLNDMRERFRLGAATLIDTIQAEERLTAAETALVDAHAVLAQTIANLRFETATLLSTDSTLRVPAFPKPVEKLLIRRGTLTTLPDLSGPPGPHIEDRNYEPNIKYISGHPPEHH